jgi:hypothetical protein
MLILDEVRKGPVTPRQKQPTCYECAPLPVVRRSHVWPSRTWSSSR